MVILLINDPRLQRLKDFVQIAGSRLYGKECFFYERETDGTAIWYSRVSCREVTEDEMLNELFNLIPEED